MNKSRRKEITDLIGDLEAIRIRVEEIWDAEGNYYAGIPANLADSGRSLKSENAMDLLKDAESDIESALSNLVSVTEDID